MAERGTWQPQWVDLAAQFPATLAKDANAESLKDGQTPDAYGLGIDRPGTLYAEQSVPNGTVWNGISAVASPTYEPVPAVWRFAHNRLWGFASGSTVYYGAYGYDSTYIIDGLGYVSCDSQESGNILQVIPFGNNVAVFKSDCLYVIRNADNPGASLVAEYVKQSVGLPVAGNVIAFDDRVYWVNTLGVYSYDGKNIVELTEPIRDNLGTFASGQITTLNADFAEKKIVGRNGATTKFIITTGDNPALYDYSTTGFRFTTRTITGTEGEPLLIDQVSFIYQYSASDMAIINFQVKINDTYKDESQLKIRPAMDNGWINAPLNNFVSCRKFAIRITDMSPNLYVSRILVHVKQGGVMGYSSK